MPFRAANAVFRWQTLPLWCSGPHRVRLTVQARDKLWSETLHAIGTENKGLLTDQAQPLSEGSLSRQQAFAASGVNSRCFLLAALLRKVDTRQDSWPILPEGMTFTGYCFL